MRADVITSPPDIHHLQSEQGGSQANSPQDGAEAEPGGEEGRGEARPDSCRHHQDSNTEGAILHSGRRGQIVSLQQLFSHLQDLHQSVLLQSLAEDRQ